MANEVEFEHGLCGCFDNCGICIITFFVPCYTFGKVAEKVGDSCCICGLVSLIPLAMCVCGGLQRGKVRAQKGIPGGICKDMLAWWCCPFCALIQEAQETKAIGSQSMASEEQKLERD